MTDDRSDDIFPISFGRGTTDEEWNQEADCAQARAEMDRAVERVQVEMEAWWEKICKDVDAARAEAHRKMDAMRTEARKTADAARREAAAARKTAYVSVLTKEEALELANKPAHEAIRHIDMLHQQRFGPASHSSRTVDIPRARQREEHWKPSLWSRLQGQLRRLKAWWDAGWEKPTVPPPPQP
jgi:hypothetical protein